MRIVINKDNLLGYALEVLKSGLKTFLKRVLGFPTGAAKLVCAGARVLHVARALRKVYHLGGGTGGLDDNLSQVIDGNLATVTNVVHASYFRMLSNISKSTYNVLHIDEVTGLLAITVYGDILTLDGLLHEDGYCGSVSTLRILTGTEYVEEAAATGVNLTGGAEHVHVVLAVQLGDTIGALGLRVHGLNLGNNGVVTIDSGRGGKHYLLAAGLGGFLKNGKKTIYVEIQAFTNLAHRLRHGHQSSHVENVINTLYSLSHQLTIRDGAFNECYVQAVKVLLVAGTKVVEYANFLSHTLIVFSNVGADKAGTAGNKNLHDILKDWFTRLYYSVQLLKSSKECSSTIFFFRFLAPAHEKQRPFPYTIQQKMHLQADIDLTKRLDSDTLPRVMAKVPVIQLRKGHAVNYNGDICIVRESQLKTPPRMASYVQMTIRSIASKKDYNLRLTSNDFLEGVMLTREEMEFSYVDGMGYHFLNTETYEDVCVSEDIVEPVKDYLIEGENYVVMFTDEVPCSIELPAAITMEVAEAPEGVKGNSANNVYKSATMSTGLVVQVPLFINAGQKISVKTEDGTYLGRVND